MKRWRPIFQADWNQAAFLHFAADPAALQLHIPFELDLFDGRAFVSLVAFTQDRLRPAVLGRVGELLSAPLSRHEFLNLRTYVRNGDDQGIYFIAEWIPNRLAALIGPATYGLPYRVGKLSFHVDPLRSTFRGSVTQASRRFQFDAQMLTEDLQIAQPGSFDAFIVERYRAYTYRDGIARTFQIAHQPWEWSRLDVDISEQTLLSAYSQFLGSMRFAGGHYSPGARNVAISGPQRTDIFRRRVYNGVVSKFSWRA